MPLDNLPPPPAATIPPNALAGPVLPQLPSRPWNGLAIVGEAPGRQEAINEVPFSGPAGELLNELLERAGIERDACFVVNPFLYQPVWTPLDNNTRRNNDIMQFFTKDVAKANTRIHDGATYRGAYVREVNVPDLRYTWTVLHRLNPKAILAMGATALWFTTGEDRISDHRGQILKTPIIKDVPVIPTFHTAFALYRNADQHVIDTITEDMSLVLPYL